MKKLFIIGNWKSFKTTTEATEWFQEITNNKLQMTDDKEVVICAPFTALPLAKSLINQHNLPIKLGAQDISPFDEGRYTGAVNGKQLAEFVQYVIIGHSERRKYFFETEGMVNQKVQRAIESGITPIVCVSEVSQIKSLLADHHGKEFIVAYEPLFAIGSGQPDSPENAEKTSAEIQKEMENITIIYGGSVTSENVHSFTSMPTISGVLPGGASLVASEFAAIVTNA